MVKNGQLFFGRLDFGKPIQDVVKRGHAYARDTGDLNRG